MHVHLSSGADFYLDGLVVDSILSHMGSRELATLSTTCKAMQGPSQQMAQRKLVYLVSRMQGTLLRHCERGSHISQLREWETVEASNVLWLQAEAAHMVLVKQGEQRLVKRCADLSGRGNLASMYQRMPVYRPDALNGRGILEFDGSSVLKTRPFAQPLQQPVTIMVVARARGDTTILDALGPQ